MRSVLVVLFAVSVMLVARSAHAVRFRSVVNVGNDVIHIRDLPPDVASRMGHHALGYLYDRFGLFWLDLWRGDGQFVVYTEGTFKDGTYAPLSREDLAALGGARMPWKYRAPPGLAILLTLAAFAVVRRMYTRPSVMYVLGAIWLVLAVVLFVHDVVPVCLLPAALGVHHLVATRLAVQKALADEELASAPITPRKKDGPYR